MDVGEGIEFERKILRIPALISNMEREGWPHSFHLHLSLSFASCLTVLPASPYLGFANS